MNIPTPITEFFRLKNAHDDAGLEALFSEDAVVVDAGEGREMRGMDEIRAWIQKSISGLNLHTEIKNAIEKSGEWVLDTTVSGDFKASPAKFEYFIQIEDEKIVALRVEFRGSLQKVIPV